MPSAQREKDHTWAGVTLCSREEFEMNPNAYRVFPVIANPIDPVAVFLGAHCAGMNQRSPPDAVYAALLATPDPTCAANRTVKWLFGSMKLSDAMTLVARCGISIGRIADHVHMNEVLRRDLIVFLNQFAVAR